MMSFNVGDSALLFIIKSSFFFNPPCETLDKRLPGWLRSERYLSSRRAHPCNEVQSPKDAGFAAF